MASLTPWTLRVADPVWREDHDYPANFIVTGSDGAIYIAKKESGPNTTDGVKDPTTSNEHWISLKDSLSTGGANAMVPGDIGAATSSSSGSDVATSAEKLSTARTITLAGDVTGSTSFDGSQNVTISTTVQAITVHNEAGDDFNSLTTSGKYFVATTQGSSTNAPLDVTGNWWVDVSVYTSGGTTYILQVARLHGTEASGAKSGSANVLARCCTNSTWGTWEYAYTQFAG